jgi:hypothetical protein
MRSRVIGWAVAIVPAVFLLTACSLLGPIGSDTGDGSTKDVFTIAVGDCLNDNGVDDEVSEVPVVDCADPHDSEAYASVLLPDGDFPGDDSVETQAVAQCTDEFATFIGLDYAQSSLQLAYFYPTQTSWEQGDREILCLVVDPAGQTTGSLAGASR